MSPTPFIVIAIVGLMLVTLGEVARYMELRRVSTICYVASLLLALTAASVATYYAQKYAPL